ncbi:hypothetical protein [Paraburkholderia sp. RL17-337-BIB-A]|uniref:hypothetical protein n=1 Tax=Paraburkholderia sp. RL17-337-BIB-A TaxID=3031636 RepID=UPI0038B8C9B9
MLALTFYAGEYTGDKNSLTHLCDIEGSSTPGGRPPFTTLEEARHVLETCTERYSTPTSTEPTLTVFIGRKKRGKTTPLARLDVLLQDGLARASIVRDHAQSVAVGPVAVDRDDDVATIACKVLTKYLRE